MSPTPLTLGVGAWAQNGAVDHVAQFEAFLGRRMTQILVYLNAGTWAQTRANVDSASAAASAAHCRPDWSVGLTVTGTTLAQVAAGSNDADFTYLATKMAVLQPSDDIRVRLGWEMNGNYFPWYAVGNEANYIAAFQRVVGLFRAASTRFKFVFCPNQTEGDGNGGYINPETMYPGNAYVDIIGMDSYYDSAYDSPDGPTAFNYKKSAPYGWSWQCDFARRNQKALAMNEWGVNMNGAQAYVALVAQWFRAQGYLYHNYWDSTDSKVCELSDGSYPTTGAQFVTEFSKTF